MRWAAFLLLVVGAGASAFAFDNFTPELRQRIEALRDGETLTLEKGVYHLYPDGAKEMFLAPSGNEAGTKRVAMPLVGRKGVTVDGGGSRFVVHHGAFPFAAQGCADVTVRNCTFAASQLPVKEFTVVSKDAKGFLCRMSEQGPACRVEGDGIVFGLESGAYRSNDHVISVHVPARAGTRYLFCGRELKADKDSLAVQFMPTVAEDRGEGKVYLRFVPDSHPKAIFECPFEVGQPLLMLLASERKTDVLLFDDCARVAVRDVTIESGVGMGVVAQLCEDVSLERYRVVPPEGSHVTLTADSIYLVDCNGRLSIADGEICWGLDDPINVHGNYTRLDRADGRQARLRVCHHEQRGVFLYRVGGRVEFVRGYGTKRTVLGTAKITSFRRPQIAAETAEIVFDREIPSEWVGSFVANRSHAPEVTIRGNSFHDYLNMRLSAFGDFLIEKNRYARGNNVVFVKDLIEYWGECGPVRRMTVRDNDIGPMDEPCFWIRVPSDEPVVIEGNRYTGIPEHRHFWNGEGVRCIERPQLGTSAASLLRVGANVLDDPAAAEAVWQAIEARPGAFGEITVFTQLNHSLRSLDYHRALAPKVAAFLRQAEAHGLRTGINVLTTIGFFEDEFDEATASLPMAVSREGTMTRGRLCPSAPETLAYVRELYAIYAKCRPSFIYVDDDVSMCPCGCERCRSREAGTAVDGVLAAVAQAVRAVDPKIALGFMNCLNGPEGLAVGRWMRTLAGEGRLSDLKWRPGGGCWTDASMADLLDKAHRMAAQTRGLPSEVGCVQSEIENFPYQSLSKSPSFMAFESLLYLAACCTGTSWSFCSLNVSDREEFLPYFDAVADSAEARAVVSAAFGRRLRKGIAVRQPCDLASIGLPSASDPAQAEVTLLDGPAVQVLGDAELTNVLSRGVFLDAEALEAVNSRGFGDWTGFAVDGRFKEGITRDLEHPLNASGRHYRDLRAAFGGRGPLALLKRTAAGAAWTEEAVTTSGKVVGFAGGVFENAVGGRVAVESLLPFARCEGRSRTIHLKRLMRWLSRETLTAFVASFHKAAVFACDGALFAANLETEPLADAEVALSDGGRMRILVMEAGRIVRTEEIDPVRRDGAYAIYRLPAVPVLGEVLMTVR